MRFALSMVLCLLLISCHPLVKITFNQPDEKTLITSTLKDYFKNPRNVILLRIPTNNSLVSSTSKDTARLYDYIEEGFFKRGFEIRDRAIFEKVLTQSSSLDYDKVVLLTKTDIILEISITPENYSTNRYSKNGNSKISSCNFQFSGDRIDVKIIKVRENQVAALYRFYQAPCTSGCAFKLNRCRLMPPTRTVPITRTAYSIHHSDQDIQSFAESIVSRLAQEMM